MAAVDVQRLLEPVSEDAPSGPDLEYDATFQAMVEASKGKPEKVMGDEVRPAVDPDWRSVKELAVELLARTRDVRPLTFLAAATTAVDGVRGLGSVLEALRALLDAHWATIHPELDREDNDDPTMRFNALRGLCDPEGLLRCVRESTLVSARGIGQFSLRSIQVAQGHAPHTGDGDPPSMAMIEGAFLDSDLDELRANGESIDRAIAALSGMDADLAGRVGAGMSPDFSALESALKEVQSVLNEQLSRRGAATPDPASAGLASAAASGPAPTPAAAAPPGEVNSREDVIRSLDKICDFYQKNEPSSPIPLLINRAKRLVDKSFVDILKDIAPGGMSEVETIGGLDTE